MVSKTTPAQIRVLAGVNGAGKSSIVGATIRDKGGEYYNPDEAAREIMAANPGLGQTEANAAAWEQGRKLLERAIDQGLDFTFETTLGGNTMPDCWPRPPNVASRSTSSTLGSAAPTPTSSGCDKGSAPAGMTFPKPTSAVATATA